MERAASGSLLAAQLETLYTLGAVGSFTDDELLERFLARTDKAASEAAFAALVERHGAMVFSVCQRIVRQHDDAHDAFQATFLVLARRARSIHGRGTVAAWLFGIARRIAARARVDTSRRRRLEKLHAERRIHDDVATKTQAEEAEPDYSPLIAAIDRLPERYRMPVVLYYFEGLNTEAVARRLGCPRGTVLSRLARARERLRRRLEYRGVSLETLMPAASASGRLFTSTTVPSSLVYNTVRAASCLALGETTLKSVVPASVASLSSAVVRNLVFAKLQLPLVLVILSVGSATIGLSMATPTDDKPELAASQTKSAREQVNGPQPVRMPKANENLKRDSVAIRGRVLDPDGKPVARPRIVLGFPDTAIRNWQVPLILGFHDAATEDWPAPRRLKIGGADGRFEVVLSRETLSLSGPNRKGHPMIAALAPRFGPAWVELGPDSADKELTLRLRRDDVPIEGRILNLEGKPVSGLNVYMASLTECPAELIKKIRENAGKPSSRLFWDETTNSLNLGKEDPFSPVQTGPDGRFHRTGAGRDRAVALLIEGETIEQSMAMVYTTSDPTYNPPLLPADGWSERNLLGPRFDFIVAPGRAIEGIIRDRDSGRPVSRTSVRAATGRSTTSDDEGWFRIPGQLKMPNNLVVVTSKGQPYFTVFKPIDDPPGLGPIRVDIALKRGVWVEGRVTNRADGRPVNATVRYYPMPDNRHVEEYPDATFSDNVPSKKSDFPTDPDGRFRALALPGRGILAVRTTQPDYPTVQSRSPNEADSALPDALKYLISECQALLPINLGDAEKVIIPNIVVVQSRTQHVKVVAPDGKPVIETRLFGNLMRSPSGRAWSGTEFTFVHTDPGKEEPILVVNRDETAGALLVVKGNEPDPISITLQPAATVTGRLVDEKGRPRPDVPFVVMQDLKTIRVERYPGEPPTGPDGRFRIRGLVAGVSYTVREIAFNAMVESEIGKPAWTVKSGETQDWGDVQAKKSSTGQDDHPVR
jgi:RNA polymerase sigma factor (sigma-70 family)